VKCHIEGKYHVLTRRHREINVTDFKPNFFLTSSLVGARSPPQPSSIRVWCAHERTPNLNFTVVDRRARDGVPRDTGTARVTAEIGSRLGPGFHFGFRGDIGIGRILSSLSKPSGTGGLGGREIENTVVKSVNGGGESCSTDCGTDLGRRTSRTTVRIMMPMMSFLPTSRTSSPSHVFQPFLHLYFISLIST